MNTVVFSKLLEQLIFAYVEILPSWQVKSYALYSFVSIRLSDCTSAVQNCSYVGQHVVTPSALQAEVKPFGQAVPSIWPNGV